jgi:hypothetical protein
MQADRDFCMMWLCCAAVKVGTAVQLTVSVCVAVVAQLTHCVFDLEFVLDA